MQPKIDHVYELLETAIFTNLQTAEQRQAGRECIVQQLRENPTAELLPYHEDPLIIRVDALVVKNHLRFTDTNEPVDAVIWTDMRGVQYAAPVSQLNADIPGLYMPELA